MAAEIPTEAEVVIIGGGPAGLAAATALRRAGVSSVVVLEREPQAGGIPRHCGHYPFGLREFRRLLRGPAYAARLVRDAEAAGVAIRTGVTVLSLLPGPGLRVTSDAGVTEITAKRILLATGVRESSRAARMIGGTKPGGVLSTGALQGIVYLDGMRPFRRPVILGTELVSFSALMTCRHAGIRPVAIIEPGPRATARWPAALFPRLLGIPIHYQTEIAEIEGVDRVSGVVLRKAGGQTLRLDADGVIVSGRFRPEASLVRASHLRLDAATGGPEVDEFGRCSDPDYFAAGNLLRPVETAGASWAEGRAIAGAILRSLSGDLPSADAGTTVQIEGDALKYVMPQRVVAGGQNTPALASLQLRLLRPVRGRIILRRDGKTITAWSVNSLPERRVTIPLPAAPGLLTLTCEDDP